VSRIADQSQAITQDSTDKLDYGHRTCDGDSNQQPMLIGLYHRMVFMGMLSHLDYLLIYFFLLVHLREGLSPA
jgi:hypothetical protein